MPNSGWCRGRLSGVLWVFLLLLPVLAGTAWGSPMPWEAEGAEPSPVIFIPGKCGSQIEAHYAKESSAYPHCPRNEDWHRIWLDVWQLIMPEKINCWTETMAIKWDSATKTSSNIPGAEFRVPGWGDTENSEYIDPSWAAFLMGNAGAYLVHTVNEFVSWGMERSVSVRVAPYDFRYAPHSMHEYFDRLRLLVEETYMMNGGRRVVLLSHSMGGLYGLYFLMMQDQAWKDHYIKAYVPINSPWKGSALVSYLYASGYNWGLPIERPHIKGMMRVFETAALLLPHEGRAEEGAWDNKEVIIQTAHRNYTAHDYRDFFRDIGYPVGWEMLQAVRGNYYDQRHPGVDTHCVYSSGLDTPRRFIFEEGQFPDGYADIVMGPGDGTVDLSSLLACEHFLKVKDTDHVGVVKEFPDMQHIDLLYDRRLFDYLKNIIYQ